jgi:Fe-S cluster assembly protein SufB
LNNCIDDAEIKYSTVQNWYPGNKEERWSFQFCDQRGLCEKSKNFLDTGRNWFSYYLEIPIRYFKGDSVGEFYSIAVTNNFQQADTGTK